MEKQIHNILPVFDNKSKILILGSFPSVKSRENEFFYGHPQNRFWKVISKILENNCPQTIEEKKNLLISNNIALWDVIESCNIKGSSDSSISDVRPNDLSLILENSNIKQIFTNGKTAEKYYNKYIKNITKLDTICLPSTSPANASKSIDDLIIEWNIIKKYL